MRSKADVKNRLRSDRRSGCRDLIQVIVARRDQPHWVEQPIHFLRVQLPSQKGPRQATRWMAEGGAQSPASAPHATHSGADVDARPLARRSSRGTGYRHRPNRLFEQAKQTIGNETSLPETWRRYRSVTVRNVQGRYGRDVTVALPFATWWHYLWRDVFEEARREFGSKCFTSGTRPSRPCSIS